MGGVQEKQMEQYKVMLFEKIKNQITDWFEASEVTEITNRDVYLFLHSIKGTSGTIGLGGLQSLASNLLVEVEQEALEKEWDKEDLLAFLDDLIALTYQYEHFETEELHHPTTKNEDAPLIQIVDEDVSMLILLKDFLESENFMVIAQTDSYQAMQSFYDLNPDCLIMTIHSAHKFSLLEMLHHHLTTKFTPTILLNSDTDRETRLVAYRLGVDDYVEKPLDLEEFLLRVKRLINRKKLFNQTVLIDELTQVYNRRFLNEILTKSVSELSRVNTYFTVAVLDLDYFKKINDTYGHVFGDEVLVTFAQVLKNQTRNTDTVCRYGGEEFIVIFPHTKDVEAKQVLMRILEHFKEKAFFPTPSNLVTVSFSAGVFTVYDRHLDGAQIIKMADQALYTAKQNGRSQVVSANQIEIGATKKILYVSIIDDDEIIRSMLWKIMQSMEMEHVTIDLALYEDGEEFFRSKRQDLVGQHFLILDGVMPSMDGTEVLQRVKTGRYRDFFHILMLTSRKNDQDISRALKLGADDYVTKPFSMHELQARIYRLILRITQ